MWGFVQVRIRQREVYRFESHILTQPPCDLAAAQPQKQPLLVTWRSIPGVSAIKGREDASKQTPRPSSLRKGRTLESIR